MANLNRSIAQLSKVLKYGMPDASIHPEIRNIGKGFSNKTKEYGIAPPQ